MTTKTTKAQAQWERDAAVLRQAIGWLPTHCSWGRSVNIRTKANTALERILKKAKP